MSYKLGAEDAEFMMKQFAPAYSDQDFVNMDKFKAAIKLSVDFQPTPGFSIAPSVMTEQGGFPRQFHVGG
jgi:cytochrome c553